MPSVRDAVEPGEIDVGAAADQPRLGPLALGDLDQAQRVGAVRARRSPAPRRSAPAISLTAAWRFEVA